MFRAQRADTKEWVEGYIARVHRRNEKGEIESYFFNALDELGWSYECIVSAKTVCQYTGLTDKNGVKIFEGDILSFSAYGENYKGDVRFIKGNFTIWCGKCAPFLDDALEKHSAIVIGKIFDNPEILNQ